MPPSVAVSPAETVNVNRMEISVRTALAARIESRPGSPAACGMSAAVPPRNVASVLRGPLPSEKDDWPSTNPVMSGSEPVVERIAEPSRFASVTNPLTDPPT